MDPKDQQAAFELGAELAKKTTALLLHYNSLVKLDKVAAEKYRNEQTDPFFHHTLTIQDKIAPLMKEALSKRKDSLMSAISETPEIRPAMVDSVIEDAKAEVLDVLEALKNDTQKMLDDPVTENFYKEKLKKAMPNLFEEPGS